MAIASYFPRNKLKLCIAVLFVIAGGLAVREWFFPAQETFADALVPAASANSSSGTIDFNRDIRPILSDRCFSCHGPDATARQSGLRLDLKVSAFAPLPKHTSKIAFVPGRTDLSYAYQRMCSSDPLEVMPPATSHLKVNDHERDLIRRWIEQGAHWQEFWAFLPPVRPAVPEVKDASWPRNDIDRFVLARLEQEGLQPSPEADKYTLIRRVSLDLTGLPPTPEEVKAFVADTSPKAYEKVVDRLLASPQYGEQMAVQWLDYARYADSHGFQSDPERFMWRWRDWVIHAYNSNMPFDQFTIKQLAGDLLPNAMDDDRVATGFNRNNRVNDEGGIIAEEWRVEGVIDRAETTSFTFLGLTLGCCRCHDHKFDPMTQKDFYSFTAYFNSVNEPGAFSVSILDKGVNAPPFLKVFSAEQKSQMAELTAAMAADDAVMKSLHGRAPELIEKLRESGGKLPEPKGLAVRFPLDGATDGVDAGGKAIATTFDGEGQPVYVAGKTGKALEFDGKGEAVNAGQVVHFGRKDAFSFGAWIKRKSEGGVLVSKMDEGPGFMGFELELDDGKLAAQFTHERVGHNLVEVMTKNPIAASTWVHVMVTYDGSSRAAGVKLYVDGKRAPTTISFDALTGGNIVSTSPVLIGGKTKLDNVFVGDIADVRFYGRTLSSTDVGHVTIQAMLNQLLAAKDSDLTAEERAPLEELALLQNPQYAKAMADRETSETQYSVIDDDPNNTTMVMEDLPQPRPTFILIRGQYDQHGAEVQPGVPAILPPLPAGAPANRLGLAEWIVDPGNPLTARVQANRLWEKFFGIGIVKTSENLGTQTDWPSHPELLDWLATEMISEKWDLKAFQKMIVMSATYRQSSDVSADIIERDPENRLLSHAPRLRLTAEEVRDQALAVSGLLVERVGGPSVKPYESPDLWNGNLYGNLSKYVDDTGDSLYRRSLYTFWKRTANPTNMAIFDAPTREYCVVKRSRTDTPLQALDVMNDPTYVEAARVLAQHMMSEGGTTPQERIAYGFLRATCRPATDAEVQILRDEYSVLLARFQNDPAGAAKLVGVGDSPRDKSLNVPELAAYTMTASVILNLDEMITKP